MCSPLEVIPRSETHLLTLARIPVSAALALPGPKIWQTLPQASRNRISSPAYNVQSLAQKQG